MKLQHGIALNLAIIACLSSFMLALGQPESYFILPVLTFFGSILSVYFTDIRKSFRLSGWLSNAIVISIVLYSLGDLVRTHAELLAVGIARILVLVTIVLLFREKDARTRWHILMMSFLQVVVATVFQQSLLFVVFLLVYTFAGLCAFSLIFLQSENSYFKRHSFVRPLITFHRAEFSEQQDFWRLLKIVIATLITGPLSLVLAYRRSHHEKEDVENSSTLWEASDDEPLEPELPSLKPDETFRGDKSRSVRWMLLHEKPQFSGGTTRKTGLIGGQWELFSRLAKGAVFSLVFGILLFALVPRFGEVELFGLSFSHDQWKAGGLSVRNTVGFTEEVRLGSLGNVSQNFEEVMTIRFSTSGSPGNLRPLSRVRGTDFHEYEDITGKYFYLRGVTLDNYEKGKWSRTVTPPFNPGRWSTVAPPGATVSIRGSEQMFFQEDSDLVSLHITAYPLNTPILFAIWPFFQLDSNGLNLFVKNGKITGWDGETARVVFHTTAFRHGEQIDLIPNQEPVALLKPIQPGMSHFPESDLPTLTELARSWDDESKLPKADFISRARNLEQRLTNDSRFKYQLGGVLRDEDLDPLEDFVKSRPSGHCEYFAGTLAMMLRGIGIPSRIVNGYKTLAVEGDKGVAVRQCDAHSWVEAFIPYDKLPLNHSRGKYSYWWTNGGWLRLDATPDAEETLLSGVPSFAEIKQYIKDFWSQNILNMNPTRQYEKIYKPITDAFKYVKDRVLNVEFWRDVLYDIKERYSELFRDIRTGDWQLRNIMILAFHILAVLAAIYIFFRMLLPRLKRLLVGSVTREERLRLASIGFYKRMEKCFAKSGIRRSPAETQRQFAERSAALLRLRLNNVPEEKRQRIEQHSIEEATRHIAETFYRVRYGGTLLDDSETERIGQSLDMLERL